MDILSDYHTYELNMINTNLEEFFNFILVDNNATIENKYIEFETAINALLQKNKFALAKYNEFIKSCDKPFLSYEHLINIIDDVNNNENCSNKPHKFSVLIWLYIYH